MKAKTKAGEAVSVLAGADMTEYANAAMAIIDHVGLSSRSYDKIAEILADGLVDNGHIEDDDDGVNYDKVLARLKGKEV